MQFTYTVSQLWQLSKIYCDTQLDDSRDNEYFNSEKIIDTQAIVAFLNWLEEEDRTKLL
jgi:hypothetical protein